jgi:hypothetical protein
VSVYRLLNENAAVGRADDHGAAPGDAAPYTTLPRVAVALVLVVITIAGTISSAGFLVALPTAFTAVKRTYLPQTTLLPRVYYTLMELTLYSAVLAVWIFKIHEFVTEVARPFR